jgi:hypothetical protein
MKILDIKIVIEKYEISPSNYVDIVRCDLVQGGFKRLAIDGVYTKSKANNLVFATNSLGTGGLALTLSLVESGKHPIIFLSKSDSLSHDLSLCKKMGAQLDFSGKSEPFDSDSLRMEALEKYNSADYEVLPLGLENEEVKSNIVRLAKNIFSSKSPQEIWVATASGLTIRSLQIAFPNTNFHAVLVKGNNPNVGKAEVHKPKEIFTEAARIIPPYPSNSNYDAKVWEVILEYSKEHEIKDGTVIFNIA